MSATLHLRRLQWKSRRGWLELDILLSRFIEREGDALSDNEREKLKQWLELDDPHLWTLLTRPAAGDKSLAEKIYPAPTGAAEQHARRGDATAQQHNHTTIRKETKND